MGDAFQNSDEIEAWLRTQPRDVVSVFAARAALRGVPVFGRYVNLKDLVPKIETIILPSLWAIATALSAGIWPDGGL